MTIPSSKFAASDRREIHKRELGTFLARKRASTRPEDVGIPAAAGAKRRTPGLRREEVAFAAGVGVSWYTWIEQGRAENVSGEILDSLARVLRLTTNERLYIRRLAGRDCTVSDPDTAIPDALLQPYPDNWHAGPAYVVDYRWNIRAANASAARTLGFRSGVTSSRRSSPPRGRRQGSPIPSRHNEITSLDSALTSRTTNVIPTCANSPALSAAGPRRSAGCGRSTTLPKTPVVTPVWHCHRATY